ncbi:POT family protein [Xylariaceae sp. FL0804]|nr:POT family protein [Xylariaceae sp. FL0804]
MPSGEGGGAISAISTVAITSERTRTLPELKVHHVEQTSELNSADAKCVPATSSAFEADDHTQSPDDEVYPTAEELEVLRRVKGKVGYLVYTIAFTELCERFAYTGTSVVFTNFIQQPLPPGSTTGASGTYGQPGALGEGQAAATALVTFNNFWAYLMPLVGAWLSDTYLGKYLTIHLAIVVAFLGHVILIISALPPVIARPEASLCVFSFGLIFFGVGVGFFKAVISPFIAEQHEAAQPRAVVRTLKTGERVIEDPAITISVIYMRYYFFINIGALVGMVSMVYAEKYVGFWLPYTLPTALFLLCPMILLVFKSKYTQVAPDGSIMSKCFRLIRLSIKGRWSWNPAEVWRRMTDPDFFERVKPSRIPAAQRPAWMTFDDGWVDELQRGVKACQVFCYFPVYWLPYKQLFPNMTSQAATLRLGGVPNDVIKNLNPIALLISIPVFDKLVYPGLARWGGVRLTPIRKITAGFALCALANAAAALVQHAVYAASPCRDLAGYGRVEDCGALPESAYKPALSVWVQAPAYVLSAWSEVLAVVTGLEYAFTRAPRGLRAFVAAVFCLSQAAAAAAAQALAPLSRDPHLVWLYGALAAVAALGALAFHCKFRGLDLEDDDGALPDPGQRRRRLVRGDGGARGDAAAAAAAAAAGGTDEHVRARGEKSV